MMVAIALQESRFQHRYQMAGGPARGWWQFERGGGVLGVLTHPASAKRAEVLCETLLIPANTHDVYAAIALNDALACGFARLLLWTDPRGLPTAEADGWAYYLRNWRPGKPHPQTWAACWQAAQDAVV